MWFIDARNVKGKRNLFKKIDKNKTKTEFDVDKIMEKKKEETMQIIYDYLKKIKQV